MKDTLRPGLTHSATLAVDQSLTVPNVSAKLKAFGDMPPVFATAFMVAFIEATCIEAIAQHLDDGEHSVGIHVDVSHLAATPVGMTVTVEVTLADIDGRTLLFDVSASDDSGPIGRGTHKRAVIDVRKFMSRTEEKQRVGSAKSA